MKFSIITLRKALAGAAGRVQAVRRRIRRAMLARISFAALDHVAVASWLIRSIFNGRLRASGIARYQLGREDVGLTRRDALSTMSGGVREALIDERFYAARERDMYVWQELRAAAAEVAKRIRQIQSDEPGRVVILSPFHYLSQYANVCIIEELRIALGLETISAVSGIPRDIYGNDMAMVPSIRVLHTYDQDGAESRNAIGLRVVRALRRDGVAVLFADVPPFTFAKFPMETIDVSMEDRKARVHRGVFRIGAAVNALLLPCYLRFDKGHFGIRILEPIALAQADAPQQLADAIVAARNENYPHWLYAGHPCVYHFATTR
jgi:hypothetical protein